MGVLAVANDSFLREAALWWGGTILTAVGGLLVGVFRRLGKIHQQNKGMEASARNVERQTKTSNGRTLAQIIEDMAFRQEAIEEKQETLAADQSEMRRELEIVKGSVRSLQGSVSALAIHVGVEERDRATSRRRRQQTERQQKGTVK